MEITFLNNANLPEATLTNAKMELISAPEKRDRGDKDIESVPVLIEHAVKLKDVQGRYKALEVGARVGRVQAVEEKYR